MRTAVSALVAFALAGPAVAAEISDFELQTTADLVALCNSAGSDPLAAEAQQACFGYIAGATHFYRSLVAGGDRFKPVVCPGRELSRQEVAALLVAWADDHPNQLDELPVEGIIRAVVAEYPCPNDND